jgi:hypothetical protein
MMICFLMVDDLDLTDHWRLMIGLAGTAILCVFLTRYRGCHVKKLVREWGLAKGLAFTSMKEAGFKRVPFKFSVNSKNIVLDVTARRADGSGVHGWIQCRYSLTPLKEYTLTAKWDGDENETEETFIDSDDPLERAGIK